MVKDAGPGFGRSAAIIARDSLQSLIDALASAGYDVIGPTVRDGSIVYDRIAVIDDLPVGWTDSQAPGRYRLNQRDDAALFGFAVGQHSWKQFLHPPAEKLLTASRVGEEIRFAPPDQDTVRRAFIGVRACEIHAIEVQDRVFRQGPFPDRNYEARRRNSFIVAVNCGEAGGTCFCVSMQTGPKADFGFDLALTELVDAGRHDFLVEIGSEAGEKLLAGIPQRPATDPDRAAAAAVVDRTAGGMGRRMETEGIKELLQGNLDHPRWDEVAARCLACCNCTMVCPTCFCTTVADHSSLDGATAERVRSWDSCFSVDFSYIHGGAVRQSGRSRYRQWMTHKLAHWIDQFGTSGCVGCGRCITWCPVGIDITEEVAAIRASKPKASVEPHGND